MKPYLSFDRRRISVTEPLLGEKQVENNTGGFVFAIDPFKQFERFLILGTEGGSYYVGEQKLTRENAENTVSVIESDGKRAVDLIVDVSDKGRAVKNDPALFALALAASAKDAETRAYALAALPKVARIPTHLFHFLAFVQQFRGWGRGLKRAVADWYNQQDVERLAYQVVKYQQRDGFSNRDALRLAHPQTNEKARNLLYKWIVDGVYGDEIPQIIYAYQSAQTAPIADLPWHIRDFNLSREMLPTEALTKPEVWEALLQKMPPHALLRNLGNMSKVGLLKPMSDASKLVVDKLTSAEAIENFKKNRVHPIAILLAMKVYQSGHGMKGSGSWDAVPAVVNALDTAFYNSFQALEATGKRFLIAIDCSDSMTWRNNLISGCLQAREAAAAFALAIAKSEREYLIHGFTNGFLNLGITPRMRLTDAVDVVARQRDSYTECAVPMNWAREHKINVDCFIIITDNEVNHGVHPKSALKAYRDASGIYAKQVVMATTPTKFSIADPKDPYTMDIAGFDPTVPQAIQEFARL